MLTRTSERADLQELEALWELPASRPPRLTPERARRTSDHILKALAFAWPALLYMLIVFAPTPEPNAQVPLWGAVLSTLILLAAIAGVVARFAGGPRVGLGLFGAAGAMGIAVGVGCRASEHHAGGWWAVETAAFSVLAVAALAGLALTQRARG